MKPTRLRQLSGLSLVALLLGSARAQGQVVRYKEAASPKLWTVTEVDTFKQIMDRRGRSMGLEFHPRILKTITRPDTIIYEYILSGTQTKDAELVRLRTLKAFIGKPLPAFTLADLQGKMLNSKSLLGKPVVLNLWFTSCGPCIAEMPVLNRIRREKAHTKIVFLAMTFDSKERVQAFLKKQPFIFQHLVGARQYCNQFTTYPTTLFVDRSGVIRNVLGGIPIKYDEATNKPLSADDKEFYAALKQIE